MVELQPSGNSRFDVELTSWTSSYEEVLSEQVAIEITPPSCRVLGCCSADRVWSDCLQFEGATSALGIVSALLLEGVGVGVGVDVGVGEACCRRPLLRSEDFARSSGFALTRFLYRLELV